MGLPIIPVVFGAVKSWIVSRILKAASEDFIHEILDKMAEKFLPAVVSYLRKKVEATPGKFDDAAVDVVEKVLNDLIDG
jgi:hypothetical protein